MIDTKLMQQHPVLTFIAVGILLVVFLLTLHRLLS